MAHHVNLNYVENYVRHKMYPVEIRSKGDKANLRRASRRFGIKNGQFVYDDKRLVILSRDEQLRIVKDVHAGLGDNPRAKAMASHRGRESTYQKLTERFYWRNMVDDVASFIKTCDECQRHGKAS